jgi:hypothetical protein
MDTSSNSKEITETSDSAGIEARRCSERNTAPVITLSVLEDLRHMPLYRVADHLGISLSSLKSTCRRLGIARWRQTSNFVNAAHGKGNQVSLSYSRKLYRKYSSNTAHKKASETCEREGTVHTGSLLTEGVDTMAQRSSTTPESAHEGRLSRTAVSMTAAPPGRSGPEHGPPPDRGWSPSDSNASGRATCHRNDWEGFDLPAPGLAHWPPAGNLNTCLSDDDADGVACPLESELDSDSRRGPDPEEAFTDGDEEEALIGNYYWGGGGGGGGDDVSPLAAGFNGDG